MTSYTSTFQELVRTQERMQKLLDGSGFSLAQQMLEGTRSREFDIARLAAGPLSNVLEGLQPVIRMRLMDQMNMVMGLQRIADLQSGLPSQAVWNGLRDNMTGALRMHLFDMSQVYRDIGWAQSLITLPTLNASMHIQKTAQMIEIWEGDGRKVEPLVASITCTEAEVVGQGDEITAYVDAFDFQSIELEPREDDGFVPTHNIHYIQRSELIVAIRKDPEFLHTDESIDRLFTSQYLTCARAVCSYVTQINRFCKAIGREPMFKLTEELVQGLVALPNILAVRRAEFGEFLDYVYFIIYEGAGKDKLRFMDLINDEEAEPVWMLKNLRNLYARHDVEHGKEKDIQKKRTRLAEVFVSLIGKPLPRRRADFGNAQLNFIRQMEQMLRLIYDRLENLKTAPES